MTRHLKISTTFKQKSLIMLYKCINVLHFPTSQVSFPFPIPFVKKLCVSPSALHLRPHRSSVAHYFMFFGATVLRKVLHICPYLPLGVDIARIHP